MKNPRSLYPLAMDSWNDDELLAIRNVIDSNKFTMAENTRIFETEISEFSMRKHSIMVNSGSSANFLMISALITKRRLQGLPTNNLNIVVPAVSWSTTYTPSFYFDLELRFVDVDKDYFGLSLQNAKLACDENTIAIFAVNLLGSGCDLQALGEFCQSSGIALLEDNCESLGASIDGKMVGSFGLASSHSSFYSHHINTMEGGWVSTDDDFFADILRSLRAHGWTRELSIDSNLRQGTETDWFSSQFQFILPGLNFRPTEFQASIGVVQIRKLHKMLDVRRANARHFLSLASRFESLRVQVPRGESSWFAFAMLFDAPKTRDLVARNFREVGIECRPIVAGNFLKQPVIRLLKHRVIQPLQFADVIHSNGLYIGNHPTELTQQLDIAFAILEKLGIN